MRARPLGARRAAPSATRHDGAVLYAYSAQGWAWTRHEDAVALDAYCAEGLARARHGDAFLEADRSEGLAHTRALGRVAGRAGGALARRLCRAVGTARSQRLAVAAGRSGSAEPAAPRTATEGALSRAQDSRTIGGASLQAVAHAAVARQASTAGAVHAAPTLTVLLDDDTAEADLTLVAVAGTLVGGAARPHYECLSELPQISGLTVTLFQGGV